jgi:amino acid adenylation domain-containing protein
MKDIGRTSQVAIAASELLNEKEYWLTKFTGDLIPAYFPYDWNIETVKERHIETLQFELKAKLSLDLIKLSNSSDRRLHMILTAVLIILLNKYTGNRDIIVGTSVEKQEIIGEFINTVLPLRNSLKTGMTFKELLLQIRETLVDATDNQNYPIETLLGDLDLNADENRFPLFDVAILLENIHDEKYIRHVFPNMVFSFFRVDERIIGNLQYNSRLYEKVTIERITRHFNRLADLLLTDINVPVDEVDILSEEEKRQLLVDFNNRSREFPGDTLYPQGKTIHQLFEEEVNKNPGNIALIFEEIRLTYNQLNENANQLAHAIRSQGVKPGTIVGIMVERSKEMIEGMLGILKAGGAYLPIDPEYPPERIKYMIKDSRVNLLLTDNTLDLGSEFTGTLMDLKSGDHCREQYSNPRIINDSKDPAYIIYTSGSSGTPKGVVVEHRSIVNTLHWRKHYYEFGQTDVVLQVPSFAFDSSVEDIFTPLISGASLALYREEKRLDLLFLGNYIEKNNVSHFLMIPNFYQAFLKEIPGKLGCLNSVTLAGDDFPKELLKEHFEKLKSVKLYNEYGPAENSVCTTAFEFTADSTKVLIGSPITNVSCYILDRNRQLTPIGVPGQLCISGPGLARGYLNNPALTAEKFCLRRPGGGLLEKQPPWTPRKNFLLKGSHKDHMQSCNHASMQLSPHHSPQYPITPSPHHPIYMTGDLARWHHDGNMEFLGRADQQVKIRGVRIELEEIENQLLKIENIKEAVVVAKEDNRGDKYLCAYLVMTDNDAPLEVAKLIESLKIHLPEFIIPGYFIKLEKIPLTPNGKINREKLPQPEIHRETTYIAPRNRLEEKLVETWAEELDIDKDKIGIDSNFFVLGGHSLKATSLISKIHKAMKVEIPLLELFRLPTVRGLAEYISGAEKTGFVSIEPAPVKAYYPLSSAQYRLYVLQQMDVNSTVYNLPEILFLDEKPDRKRLEETFKKLIKRHESLRTSIVNIDGEVFQEIHDQVPFAVEYSTAAEKEAGQLLKRFVRPFVLDQAPFLRVGLVNIENRHWVLIADMHHIISDEISLGILLRDFSALYKGRELPRLRLQYKDYSEWQNQQKESAAVKKQEEYWLKVFADGVTTLQMPLDHERPAELKWEGSALTAAIDGSLFEQVKNCLNQWDVTFNILLLAAYYVLLSKYSGQEDIVVGNVVAGRRHADLENIIGFFVNMIALRNQPERHKGFYDFLSEVKENAVSAYDNQDYPFEELVGKLDLQREAGRHPLVDTVFVAQNINADLGKISPSAKGNPEIQPLKRSHFDLMLHATIFNNAIKLVMEYSTSLFNKVTVQEMLKCYTDILKQVIENKNLLLKEIKILHDFAAPRANVLQQQEIDFEF